MDRGCAGQQVKSQAQVHQAPDLSLPELGHTGS